MIKSAHLTGPVSRRAGGLFDATLRLVQSQHQQGMNVKVFGLWDEFAEADRGAWNPVPVATFKPGWPKMLGRSPQFLEALASFAPDICHTHGLWLYPSVATKRYSHSNTKPYCISPHGMLDPWAIAHARWKKEIAYWLFEGRHLRGARCIRALCASEAGSIRRLRLKNDIAVIPNGVDLPAAPVQAEAPWCDLVGPGRKVLLFLSRIHPKKGLVNLLKAWAKSLPSDVGNQKSVEWVLAIAGGDQGGHEQELKRLATELGLVWSDVRTQGNGKGSLGVNEFPSSAFAAAASGNHLKGPISLLFLGPQFGDAKAACYHHCDAFVLPSFSEGLPMVVLEAWANSKPVLMTPACNLPEGFHAGAALQAEATEASLVAGLNELRRMTEAERMAMGTHGHDLVVERFTWTQVANQMQAAYFWMLGGGAKPDCILAAGTY